MINHDLPLVELHRHLDGSIRLETILELADQHGISLPANTVEGLAPFVHVDESAPGLLAFLERFEHMTAVLVDARACRRVAMKMWWMPAPKVLTTSNYVTVRGSWLNRMACARTKS